MGIKDGSKPICSKYTHYRRHPAKSIETVMSSEMSVETMVSFNFICIKWLNGLFLKVKAL